MSSSLVHSSPNLPDEKLDICSHFKSKITHITLDELELAKFRTTLCEKHQKGQCQNADSCPHSHCLTWQRRNPYMTNYSAKLCPEIEFIRKKDKKMNLVRHCNRGKTCSHAHSKEEELYHPIMYKTKMCTSFPNCHRFFCPFAHSKEDLRRPQKMEHIKFIWGSPNCSSPDKTSISNKLRQTNSPFETILISPKNNSSWNEDKFNSNSSFYSTQDNSCYTNSVSSSLSNSLILSDIMNNSSVSSSRDRSNCSQISQNTSNNSYQLSDHISSPSQPSRFKLHHPKTLETCIDKPDFFFNSSDLRIEDAETECTAAHSSNFFSMPFLSNSMSTNGHKTFNELSIQKDYHLKSTINSNTKNSFSPSSKMPTSEFLSCPHQNYANINFDNHKQTTDASNFGQDEINGNIDGVTDSFSFNDLSLKMVNPDLEGCDEEEIAYLLTRVITITLEQQKELPLILKNLAEWIISLLERYRRDRISIPDIDFSSLVQICVEFLKLVIPMNSSSPNFLLDSQEDANDGLSAHPASPNVSNNPIGNLTTFSNLKAANSSTNHNQKGKNLNVSLPNYNDDLSSYNSPETTLYQSSELENLPFTNVLQFYDPPCYNQSTEELNIHNIWSTSYPIDAHNCDSANKKDASVESFDNSLDYRRIYQNKEREKNSRSLSNIDLSELPYTNLNSWPVSESIHDYCTPTHSYPRNVSTNVENNDEGDCLSYSLLATNNSSNKAYYDSTHSATRTKHVQDFLNCEGSLASYFNDNHNFSYFSRPCYNSELEMRLRKV